MKIWDKKEAYKNIPGKNRTSISSHENLKRNL